MVWPGIIGDPQISTQERGAKFRHQLFERVVRIAHPSAEAAIQSMASAGPMDQLMQKNGVLGFGGR